MGIFAAINENIPVAIDGCKELCDVLNKNAYEYIKRELQKMQKLNKIDALLFLKIN